MWNLCVVLLSLAAAEDLEIQNLRGVEPELLKENNYPVIGILSLPIYPDAGYQVNGTTFIPSSYIKFVEMGGARVVPIRIDHSFTEFDNLFSKLNGILFTGGNADFWVNSSATPELSKDFGEKACYLYNLVKQANDRGQFFPLWATCLGFEMIQVCANNEFGTIGNFDGEPSYTQVHQFTEEAHKSKLFTDISAKYGHKIMRILSHKKVSLLSHSLGVSPKSYHNYPKLREMFNVLSIMHDKSGSPFVGIIEAKKYPIFAVQFHPEKNLFEWNQNSIPHDFDAVAIATYFADFFVSQARKNTNIFPEDELVSELIYNYSPIYINGYYISISVFN